MHPTIHYLKNKKLLWQASHGQQNQPVTQGSGFKELDEALQGGFPDHGVIDIHSKIGVGELRLILPSILARHQQRGSDISMFIASPLKINSEMLAELEFSLEHIIVVQPDSAQLALWSAEQSLKSGCCHSVVIWHNQLTIAQVKRLQLAAEKGNSLLFIIRQPQQVHISLPVTLGLKLSAAKVGIQVQITKQKGAWPSQPFNVNMSSYWPELSHTEESKILHFPSRIGQTG